MKNTLQNDGLTVRVVAGTHAVLIGIDVDDLENFDGLGFAIRRTDHTEDEQYWLRGMKVFPSVVPSPAPGESYSLSRHPVQGFQWGDYTAKPGHDYTYRIAVLDGPLSAPTLGRSIDVPVSTELEDDGLHGVWFNRGVAASQAWNARYGPPAKELANPRSSAWAWLSRGLGEAFLDTVATATDASWSLRGAFYEFTWPAGLDAFAAAAARGAEVRLVVHGRDRDPEGAADDKDTTARSSRAAASAAGIEGLVTWRTAPNKSSLQHNKFLVLSHNGQPEAVWTGSTNLTTGAIFGHSNVGHLMHDPGIAAAFLNYWDQLEAGASTAALRDWTEQQNPAGDPLPSTVFSPRGTTSSLLDTYADLLDAATTSAHVTGAFGINAAFRAKLALARDYPRTVLLDKRPPADREIVRGDANVRIAWGAQLTSQLDQWAAEKLSGFNPHVPFIHLKVVLIDPLDDNPTILTGSANYSEPSTSDNDENTLVLQVTAGSSALSAAALQRVSDIYLTEYNRLFAHHVFRAYSQPNTPGLVSSGNRSLAEDASWVKPYLSGWRAVQRRLFAGTA